MSKNFKYANGFEGVVSDDVAKILEAKRQGKIIGDQKAPAPLSAEARGKIIEKIVKDKKATAEAAGAMSDDELKKLVKG